MTTHETAARGVLPCPNGRTRGAVARLAPLCLEPATAGNYPLPSGGGAFEPLSGGVSRFCRAVLRWVLAPYHCRLTHLLSAAGIATRKEEPPAKTVRKRKGASRISVSQRGARQAIGPVIYSALNPSFAQSLGHADFCAVVRLSTVQAVLKTRALMGRGLGDCAKEAS
jgi:hypothetical protein